MSEAFSVTLSAVAATGNITQIFPAHAAVGSGIVYRHPSKGCIFYMQFVGDGSNAGTIEAWDVNGEEGGANVNTATAITNAQMALWYRPERLA